MRYNIRLKVNSEVNKYIDLNLMASYQGAFVETNPYGATNILDRLYRIRVRQPIFTPEEDINDNPYNGDLAVNPIDLLINGGVSKSRYEDFIGKGNITIKNLVKGFRLNATFSRSADYYSLASEKRYLVWYDRLGTTVRFSANNPNSLAKTKNSSYQDQLLFTADYDLKAGDHSLHLLAGTSYENYRKDEIAATASNMNSNDFFSFNYYDKSVVTNTALSDEIGTWAMNSYFGRFNYNYKEKYLFEANMRYDGSSRLARGYRWHGFPSFSAAWRVNEEAFFDVPVISNLKVRGSWGQLGNGAVLDLYEYIPQITSGTNMSDSYYYQEKLASKKKTWETVETTDAGIDLGMFRNRLNVTADYYWKYNNNMLASLSLPSLIGVGVPNVNVGQLKTWGWEFEVKWADKINDFNYSIGFNISDSQNKLLKYDGKNTIAAGTVALLEGYPLNTIWGYKTDGYWASKDEYTAYKTANPGYKTFSDAKISGGDVKYVAQGAADHVIGSGGGTPEDPGDLVNLGSTNGRYLFGLNLNASWKGFDFGVFFQGVGKRNFLVDVQTLAPFYSTSNMPWTIDRDYWTADNTDAFWPRLYNYSGDDFNFKTSDKWVQNGAYVRLKNIQLGYTIPVKKKYIDHLRVYVSGNDVWEYSTVLSVYDPEVENNVGANFYPFFRTWTTGVSVTF